MDAIWLVGTYLVATVATLFLQLVDRSIVEERNKALENENNILRKGLAELSQTVENRAKTITVNALTSIAEEIKKEIK